MFDKPLNDENKNTLQEKGNTLFRALIAKQISENTLDRNCVVYKKNQPLFLEGSYPRGVYCINSGKIKVFTTGESGKEQIIRIASEGDVVGFRAMFGEEPYRLSATTIEESNICFINVDNFMSHVHQEPELLQAILRELSKESGERALFIKTMAQKTVRERLAIVLLVLDDIYKDEPINLTREDMANFVGTATETLIRLLKEFKDDNLIEVDGRRIKLADLKGIYDEAGN